MWLCLHQCLTAAITNKWAGKFKVEECVKPLAYCLVLPPRVRIYYVFHMVFLKKFVGEPPVDIVQLPPIKHGRVLQLMLPRKCSTPSSMSIQIFSTSMSSRQRGEGGDSPCFRVINLSRENGLNSNFNSNPGGTFQTYHKIYGKTKS